MELSENVRYMKLLHELKGAFPNMADENIQQCIKQHGMDKTACSGALRMLESQQLSTVTHNQNYAPARMMPLLNNSHHVKDLNFPRKMSLQGNNECEKILQKPRLRRPSSILPLTGINYPNTQGGGGRKLPQKPSSDSVPKVVLTPESPHSKMHRTLYDPNGNEPDSGLSMYGTTSTIEATLLDLDLESLSSMSTSSVSSTSDEPMNCSVSRATFCRSNFRFLDNRGQDVASTAFTSVTRSSSSSSTPRPRLTTTMGLSSSPMTSTPIVTNPYRRIFEQRQQFYESISMHGNNSSETSSLKSGWQRSQMRLQQPAIQHQSNKDVFTVRTNIEPFGPFVIEHDVKSNVPPKLKNSSTNKMMICLNPNNGSDEFRYATSHSGEDGVESHLEVSLGKDGSIIKTRHSRADQEENSILKLQYGEGGKVLEIQQKQSLFVPLPQTQAPSSRHNNKIRPNSAYCTISATPAQSYFVPRYNSMPNLPDGRMNLRRQQMTNEAGLLGFQTHPADEERIDIYTRALIGHQLNQRCKLQQCLQQSKSQLQNLSRDVDDLKVLLEARTQFIQNGVVDVDVSKELERDIIPKLQTSCDDLVRQVTHLTQGSVPLGETSIDFYESLPAVLAPPTTSCGEVAPAGMSSPTTMMSKSMPTTPRSSSTSTTPAIPSKSKNHVQHPMRSSSTVLTNSSQVQWPCTKCTFLNHPALKFCEECEMPRFNVNSTSSATTKTTKQTENDLG